MLANAWCRKLKEEELKEEKEEEEEEEEENEEEEEDEEGGRRGRLSKIPSERNFKAKANTTNKTKPKTIHKTRRQAGGNYMCV